MKITCVLLAAGLSIRMKENKLLMQYRGRSLLSKTVKLIDSINVDQKIIVLNDENASSITLPNSFQSVINHVPENGQSSSVRLGASRATGDAILFCTADQPFLNAESIYKIIQKADKNKIIVPSFEGRKGNPTCFGISFLPDLLSLDGNEGGKSIIRRNLDLCIFVEMSDSNIFFDIDTKEDYEKLLKSEEH